MEDNTAGDARVTLEKLIKQNAALRSALIPFIGALEDIEERGLIVSSGKTSITFLSDECDLIICRMKNDDLLNARDAFYGHYGE